METKEVKQLLQQYFDGNSSVEDEKLLMEYFQSGDIADEVKEYAEFFGGITELAGSNEDSKFQDDIMDYILEQEHNEKKKYRVMWQMVTGIAASIIIILGGVLFYEQQQQPFEDTFDNPEEAYAYATKTLKFVGSKYNVGVNQLASIQKLNESVQPLAKVSTLEDASKPLSKGARTLKKGFKKYEKIKNLNNQ